MPTATPIATSSVEGATAQSTATSLVTATPIATSSVLGAIAQSTATIATGLSTIGNAPTATLPSTWNNQTCQEGGLNVEPIPDTNPACAAQANDLTIRVMNACCASAPLVLYGDQGCYIYCEAQNTSVADMNGCIDAQANSTAEFPWICNVDMMSQNYTSTVVVQPAGATASKTGSASGGSTMATSATGSPASSAPATTASSGATANAGASAGGLVVAILALLGCLLAVLLDWVELV